MPSDHDRAAAASRTELEAVETVEGQVEDADGSPELSAMLDNVLHLRYVEQKGELKRLISVLKTYDSGYDPTIRELLISDSGLEVGQAFAGIESAMTGDARLVRDRVVVPPAGRGT